MTFIQVCPLSKVETVVATSGAKSVVSLLALTQRVPVLPEIEAVRRLHVALSDITTAMPGYLLPEVEHIDAFLRFVRGWDRREPLLIHCYAGVSRSTAAAFIALCALDSSVTEETHAERLRAASPAATPNARLVALADAALDRAGRMIEAVAKIGRGVDCFEGDCFRLPVPPKPFPDS